MIRTAVLCGIALSWPATLAAQGREAPRDTAPQFDFVVDPVAELVGIPLLRAPGGLAGARREVRLWVGFGPGEPDHLLRIFERDDGVHGQLVYWWSGEEPRLTFHGTEAQAAEWRDVQREITQGIRARLVDAGCSELYQTDLLEACAFVYDGDPGWQALMDRVDALDPWTLPDPRTFTPPRHMLDGVSLLVEVRDPSGYRTYRYSSPHQEPDREESVRATELMRLTPPAPPR